VAANLKTLLAALFGAAVFSSAAYGQIFPVKPVRLIVGFPAGGGTDTMARLISRKLGEAWPYPLVVENRPGAEGGIATELVAKAPPDGYTLAMISNAHTITPFQRKLAYDPVKDLAPVTLVASTPDLLLVHPSLPVKTLKDLIALAKTRPGELNFGSSGAGTSPYLEMELLQAMAGIRMVHVPYKGSAPAAIDLMGGHIQLMFGAAPPNLPHVKAGKLRALAVSSAQRWPPAPQIPTVSESGLSGFDGGVWYGVLAPAGTPVAIVNKIQADVAAALNAADSKKYFEDTGFSAIANKPQEFVEVIRRDMAKWGRLLGGVEAKKP